MTQFQYSAWHLDIWRQGQTIFQLVNICNLFAIFIFYSEHYKIRRFHLVWNFQKKKWIIKKNKDTLLDNKAALIKQIVNIGNWIKHAYENEFDLCFFFFYSEWIYSKNKYQHHRREKVILGIQTTHKTDSLDKANTIFFNKILTVRTRLIRFWKRSFCKLLFMNCWWADEANGKQKNWIASVFKLSTQTGIVITSWNGK